MATWYVDSSATGANDGTSLADAWNEMNQVSGGSLSAGDEVHIYPGDGYAQTLTISGVNGSLGNEVTFKAIGQIFHSTGRTNLLPEYQESSTYTDDGNGNDNGIFLTNSSYIIIDGQQWDGWIINGFDRRGIRMENNVDNCTYQYVTITNCGYTTGGAGTYSTDGQGIYISGSGNTVQYCRLFENGGDAIQSRFDSTLDDFTLYRCHMFNLRSHSSNQNLPWNYNAHTDGIQVNDATSNVGNIAAGITITDCVFGPLLTNGTLFGESGNGTEVHDLTVTNCVFFGFTDNGLVAQSTSTSDNWVVDNCTFVGHTQDGGSFSAVSAEGDCTITDCIFMASASDNLRINVDNGTLTSSGNIWNGTLLGDAINGTNVDPDFVTDITSNYVWGDFEPQAGAASGKGSTLYEIHDLIDLGSNGQVGDSENTLRSLSLLSPISLNDQYENYFDYRQLTYLYRMPFPEITGTSEITVPNEAALIQSHGVKSAVSSGSPTAVNITAVMGQSQAAPHSQAVYAPAPGSGGGTPTESQIYTHYVKSLG